MDAVRGDAAVSNLAGWLFGLLVLTIAALNLLHPGGASDFIGLGIGLPIYLWQRMRLRRAAA